MKTPYIIIFILLSWCVSAQIFPYTDYRTSTQLNDDLATLATTYPTLTEIRTIGNSLEGRPIKALKIGLNPSIDDPAKGDVVFMSTIHAREWISTETIIYLADRLLAEYATNPEVRADVDAAQVWIIPVANPDGYEFTHSATLPSNWRSTLESGSERDADAIRNHPRFWRKNRRDNGDGSFGVDLNRNYSYQWGVSGSSFFPSDQSYRGTAPFSEPADQVMRDFIAGLGNFKTLVSYHSFRELYLRPWSYTGTDPPGESTLRSIVQRNINLIFGIHGHIYGETIEYLASGGTADFIWHTYRAAAFSPELRPTLDAGMEGFYPLPGEILPTAQEQYPAAIALLHDAARTGIYIRDHAGDTGAEPSATWTGTGWSTPFWVSPDIWTVPASLNQNATVDLNIRVNNATSTIVHNVTLDVYYTDPRISLEFPNPDAMLIGSRTISVPSSGITETFRWTTPIGTNTWGERHWCIGAVVRHQDDMPLTTQIQRSSNLSCRNFNTTGTVESATMTIAARNFLHHPAELFYAVDEATIKEGWTVEMPDEILKRTMELSETTIRKSKLLMTKGLIMEPGETLYLPVKVSFDERVHPGDTLNLQIPGTLLPLVAGKREAVGNGFTYQLVAKAEE